MVGAARICLEMLKPFTFNVFIDMVKFTSLVLLFFSLFVPSMFVYFFLFS